MLRRTSGAVVKTARSTRSYAPFSTNRRISQKYDSSVQTPVQSQNKDSVVPSAARPEAEASVLETPLQRQRREALAPQQGRRDPGGQRAVYGLLAGVIGIPPFVYYYYQQRRDHMDNKRANLMEQQRQRYAGGG